MTGSFSPGTGDDSRLWLEGDESVVTRLTGLGASLFVTTHRLVIVRDGAEIRPRSGVRSWPHHELHGVWLSPPKRGQARIVVRAGSSAEGEVSMFFAAEVWYEAERTVSEIRRIWRLGRDHG